MANLQKFTKGAVIGLSHHIERKTGNHSNENINLEKSEFNYSFLNDGSNMISRMKKRLNEVYCFNRKDVKVCCSWIVTLPKDFYPIDNRVFEELKNLKEQLNELDRVSDSQKIESKRNEIEKFKAINIQPYMKKQKEFFQATFDYLKLQYGEENILAAEVHNDEMTPHIHFSFVPVIEDKKHEQGKKVSAKEVITLKHLKRFHEGLDNYVKKKVPDYKYGIRNGTTDVNIKSVKGYKKAQDEIEKLLVNKKSLEEEYQFDVEMKVPEIMRLEGELNFYKSEVENVEEELSAKKIEKNDLNIEILSLQKQVEELKRKREEEEELKVKIFELKADSQILESKNKSLINQNVNLTASNKGLDDQNSKLFEKNIELREEVGKNQFLLASQQPSLQKLSSLEQQICENKKLLGDQNKVIDFVKETKIIRREIKNIHDGGLLRPFGDEFIEDYLKENEYFKSLEQTKFSKSYKLSSEDFDILLTHSDKFADALEIIKSMKVREIDMRAYQSEINQKNRELQSANKSFSEKEAIYEARFFDNKQLSKENRTLKSVLKPLRAFVSLPSIKPLYERFKTSNNPQNVNKSINTVSAETSRDDNDGLTL